MKPLLIWLAIIAVVFGAYALITSAVRDTTQIYVVVDSSFQMRPVWRDVVSALDRIDDEEHAEFALATEKGPVHSWQSDLALAGVDIPFGICGFDEIADSPEALEADERILITTTSDPLCPTDALVDWEIIELGP